ncbi:MAG TPA: DUF1993 domain-containing protein [Variovorax sp.]|nr:DUF1993 domain-containing protein [Variovorax sp.]
MQQFDLQGLLVFFTSRLDTLKHLLRRAEAHFEPSQSFLDHRVAPDMFPLRTQVVFACNQPRSLALWCEGQPVSTTSPDVSDLGEALSHIEGTKALLLALGDADARMPERARITLGSGLHADLTAYEYVNDFLVPNFYFHLVAAYAILRMAGLPIGKADYMLHMRDLVRQDDG